MRDAPPGPIGRVLGGRYRVLELIGAGGMGAVYKATHLGLGRVVALKLLHGHVAGFPGAPERFHREAMLLARLRHPGAVLVHDFGADGDELYIAMELLEGITFDEVVFAREQVSIPRAISLVCQALEPLEAAHALGIIHRDLKPSNLMIISEGAGERVKVLDFGLATVVGDTGLARLTQTGTVQGTPEYMSPEQCKGEPVGPRADLYSLGCILYELLTGQLPFNAGSSAEVFAAHLYRPPVPPRQLVPERAIPAALEQAVLRALAKLPADRPADARAMSAELQAALSGRMEAPRGEGKKKERAAPEAGSPRQGPPEGAAPVAVLEPADSGVSTALNAAGFAARLVAPGDSLEGASAVVLVPSEVKQALSSAIALLHRAGSAPVLLCGPEDDLALMASAIEAGVYDYIPLPLDPVDLSKKVARAQRRRR